MIDESAMRVRFAALAPVLDERGRRRFAAAGALAAGRGGVRAAACATGSARSTIGRGLAELRSGEKIDAARVRRPGGGRKTKAATDASLVEDVRGLADPPARGDPESPLRWTCKSPGKLAQGLRDPGHKIGRTLAGELLRKEGYSLQSNVKTLEGSDNPDRDRLRRSGNCRASPEISGFSPLPGSADVPSALSSGTIVALESKSGPGRISGRDARAPRRCFARQIRTIVAQMHLRVRWFGWDRPCF